MLDTLLIWDKGLARKIDQALFGVESKVMAPINYMLQRVNAMSSLFTAILTISGRFDATTFLHTAITNIRQAAHAVLGAYNANPSKPSAPPAPPVVKTANDLHSYLKDGGGDLADPINQGLDTLRSVLAQTSGVFGG